MAGPITNFNQQAMDQQRYLADMRGACSYQPGYAPGPECCEEAEGEMPEDTWCGPPAGSAPPMITNFNAQAAEQQRQLEEMRRAQGYGGPPPMITNFAQQAAEQQRQLEEQRRAQGCGGAPPMITNFAQQAADQGMRMGDSRRASSFHGGGPITNFNQMALDRQMLMQDARHAQGLGGYA